MITVLLMCAAFLTLKLNANAREINLAGLIVDAANLQPVEAAEIFSADNKLLGSTNKNGFYNITFNCNETGEIHFKLKIKKQGYNMLSDNEHWGDLGDAIQMIMYFGLKPEQSTVASFSDFADKSFDTSMLDYETVAKGFEKVKAEQSFEKKLSDAEKGNENVFFKINDAYFIAGNGSWIKLHSDKDIVSINKKQHVAASDLNKLIKRKNINGMTPVQTPNAQFEIDTK